MTRSSATTGPWEAAPAPHGVIDIIDANGHDVLTVYGLSEKHRALARLIAEAGTVKHETGLSPRELVEERDRLREALEKIIEGAPTEEPEPYWDDFGYFSDDYSDLYHRGVETQHWRLAEIARSALAQPGSKSEGR